MARRRPPIHVHHGHSRAKCLEVFRRLSAYLDEELNSGLCAEIRKHLCACQNCEEFLDSLRQTITLCRHAASRPLSPSLKARIRGQILKAASRC